MWVEIRGESMGDGAEGKQVAAVGDASVHVCVDLVWSGRERKNCSSRSTHRAYTILHAHHCKERLQLLCSRVIFPAISALGVQREFCPSLWQISGSCRGAVHPWPRLDRKTCSWRTALYRSPHLRATNKVNRSIAFSHATRDGALSITATALIYNDHVLRFEHASVHSFY